MIECDHTISVVHYDTSIDFIRKSDNDKLDKDSMYKIKKDEYFNFCPDCGKKLND